MFESGMRKSNLIGLLCGLTHLASSFAAPPAQSVAGIQHSIRDFLQQHCSNLPGTCSYSLGAIEASPGRSPCTQLSTSLAPGAQAYGKTTVQVRCESEPKWAMYVPVQVTVVAPYLTSARGLQQGQLLTEADVALQDGNLSDLPAGVLNSPTEAVGRIAGIPIKAGQPLQASMLRLPNAVQAGQTVRVVSRGPGFEVSSEGRALNAAPEGKTVQVRLANGQLITGIARPGGVVDINR